MGHEQIVTCLECFVCFYHDIVGAGHASHKSYDAACGSEHYGPRHCAVFDTSVATTPFARRWSKLIKYWQVERQTDRQFRRRAKTRASSHAMGRIAQYEHDAQQQRNSAAFEVSQVRLRATVNAIATPLWCESAKHDFQLHRARRQFLTTSNFRRSTTPTQCAPARAIF